MGNLYYYNSVYHDFERKRSALVQAVFIVDGAKPPDWSMTQYLLCRPKAILALLSPDMFFLHKRSLADWIKKEVTRQPRLAAMHANEFDYVVIECLSYQYHGLRFLKTLHHKWSKIYGLTPFDVNKPSMVEMYPERRDDSKQIESNLVKRFRKEVQVVRDETKIDDEPTRRPSTKPKFFKPSQGVAQSWREPKMPHQPLQRPKSASVSNLRYMTLFHMIKMARVHEAELTLGYN